jgi:hypothetical protein
MEPENLLVKVVQILEDLDIPYLITGGIAVAVWGRPRATFDIDIIVEISEGKISSLVKALKKFSKAGYIDEEMAREALREKGEFNFIDPETGLKVDFWVQREDAFSKSEFTRKISRKIGDKEIYFISPEDLILKKLKWYKLSETSKHLEDIESILKISSVDLNYIERWAKKQSTVKILEQITRNHN